MPTIDQMRAALAEEGQPSIDEMRLALEESSKSKQKAEPKNSAGMSALEHFGNAASLGYLPQISAATEPVTNKILDFLTGNNVSEGDKSTYVQRRDEVTRRLKQQEQEHPTASMAGSIGGGLSGGIAMMPLLPGAQAAKAGGGLLSLIKQGAITGAKQGAVYGAVSNPGDVEGQVSPLQPIERLQGTAQGAAFGGAVGGAVPAAIAGGKKVVEGIKEIPSSLLSYLGGVKKDVIKEYTQFHSRINAAPSIEELKNVSDDFVGKLAADVESAKLNHSEAKDAFKAFESDLKDTFRNQGYDAKEAVASAKITLENAHRASIQNTAQDIVDTVKSLQDEVVAGSSKSFEILEKSGIEIPVAPVKAKITTLINQMKVNGQEAVGSEAKAAISRLEEMRASLDGFSKKIPAAETKKLLQQIQRDASYGMGPGQFNGETDKATKEIAAFINQGIKSKSPEYAAQMEKVAADTGLLSQSKEFGDRHTGAQILSNIESLAKGGRKEALDALGQKYGVSYLDKVNPSNLPEFSALQSAENQAANFRPDRVSDAIQRRLEASKQAANLGASEMQLGAASEKLAPFKSLAPNSSGQTTAEAALKRLGTEKAPIELKQMFSELGKLSGTDFVQAMKDRNVLETFNKASMNGSRNTLFGTVIGYMAGGVYGGSAGAAMGRAADIYGPQVTKKIIDASIKFSERPTMQTIASLEIPQMFKDRLIEVLKIEAISNKTLSNSNFQQAPRYADRENNAIDRKISNIKGNK